MHWNTKRIHDGSRKYYLIFCIKNLGFSFPILDLCILGLAKRVIVFNAVDRKLLIATELS